MTIDAFRARQCRPFLAVLATVLFLAASAFAQDASYLESGDSNFNNPANWTGGAVPKGTATIALQKRSTPITFSAPFTPLQAIVVSYYAPLIIDKIVTLGVDGSLSLVGSGMVSVDTDRFEGPVIVRGTSAGAPILHGHGTIVGNVEVGARGAGIAPGGLGQSEGGKLTVSGSVTLIDQSNLTIRVTGASQVSRLAVTNDRGGSGRVTIGPEVTIVFACYGSTLPYDKPIPFLTTVNGLLGKFQFTVSTCGGEVTYDAKNAYVTFRH